MEPASNRLRLSVMMFGLYLIVGAWAVTLATYLISSPLLGGLSFSAKYVSWIYNTWAFGGLLAPIFIGLLADRLFAVQRLLALFSFLGGALLIFVALWCESQQANIESIYRDLTQAITIENRPMLDLQMEMLADPQALDPELKQKLIAEQRNLLEDPRLSETVDHAFYTLFGLMFCYCFCCIMTIGCSNVMGFRNLAEPQKNYGRIRLFGTVGWIFAGLIVAFSGTAISHFPLFFAAGLSFVMGVYHLTLPHTPPLGQGKTLGEAFGLPALQLFRERPFRILLGSVFLMSMVQQFYGVYANKFLNDLHLPRPAGFQTIAQVGEVLCMAILPWVVDHWGMRKTMLAGLLGWTLRNALFSTCEVSIVSFVGLPIHGLSFAFFFVTAMIYVDRQAPRKLRASSQGIFTFISSGMGVLSGNMLAAWVVKLNTQGEMINWQPVWVVPMLMSAGVLVFFWIGFRPQLDKVHLEPGEAGKHLVEDIEELASAS